MCIHVCVYICVYVYILEIIITENESMNLGSGKELRNDINIPQTFNPSTQMVDTGGLL